ncbi:MAG: alkylmercury lyase family protein [Actinomycetota bacterium]|nr:alkylmercury lyase family protein [Actinomycetota bacterium]
MDLEDLRLLVYDSFRRLGRVTPVSEMATELGCTVAEVSEGLGELARQRHLALDATGEIVMAHPFSAVNLGFSVMGRDTLWWGGCCWDSFALPHLLTEVTDVLVATRCPGCDRPGAWVVERHRPPAGDWVAHFLVPAAHVWDDVVHTCNNQRLFCSEECVQAWLDRTGNTRGYVMDIDTLWHFASHWYEGRLERGYVRREPSEAKDYFRSVGLVDPFWGT